ncbi:MAG: type II secretion system protein [Hyphomicrobiales bacterium]|nr:MAG: type II secretion system protein [Hyphomicrobiales bacterium]
MFETVYQTLTNGQFLAMAATGIAIFATIISLAMPYLQTDKLTPRLKSVSGERKRLREEQKKQFEKQPVNLRGKDGGLMKQFVDKFNLYKLLAEEDISDKLKRAGLRGQAPMIMFLFFRFVMPIILFVAAMLVLFLINDFNRPVLIRFAIAVGLALIGYYLPGLFISNLISKRQLALKRAFPDTLDLLLICVEAGMSIEAAFAKVAEEIATSFLEMSEEMSLTNAELSYLPQRKIAYLNLAKRTGLEGVKAVTTALIQAERYGTPLANTLRVMAQENRDMRMSEAEKKAAGLPPKLTVPMIAFFLPVIFIVIMGPAIMRISHMF